MREYIALISVGTQVRYIRNSDLYKYVEELYVDEIGADELVDVEHFRSLLIEEVITQAIELVREDPVEFATVIRRFVPAQSKYMLSKVYEDKKTNNRLRDLIVGVSLLFQSDLKDITGDVEVSVYPYLTNLGSITAAVSIGTILKEN